MKNPFYLWYMYHYQHKATNEELITYLECQAQKGWLKKTRQALHLSSNSLADKLQISRAGYHKLEKNEEIGAITINTLSKVAEAMDCELVYCLRPKSKKSFAQIIWQQLSSKSASHRWVKLKPPGVQPKAQATIARNLMKDGKFRNQQGWTERKSSHA